MAISEELVQRVWEKGKIVPNNDPGNWRKDECGAWIGRKFYGDRSSQYGWEVDHIKPASEGGIDTLSNLRPLHWANNAEKQGGRLTCPVTADGTKNVSKRSVLDRF